MPSLLCFSLSFIDTCTERVKTIVLDYLTFEVKSKSNLAVGAEPPGCAHSFMFVSSILSVHVNISEGNRKR